MAEAGFEYDPYAYEVHEDPYPLYARLRDEAPAYYNPRLDFWALTRFEDCLAGLLDWQTYSSAQGTVLELMGDSPIAGSIIIFIVNLPDHLLQNVLEGDNPQSGLLRRHDAHVNAPVLEHLEP